MKRPAYLFLFILIVFCASCSEDESVNKPAAPTLQQDNVYNNSVSYRVIIDESISSGSSFAAIQKEGSTALTHEEIKSRSQAQTVSGGQVNKASFSGLNFQTSYVIYAFIEVEGVTSDITTLNVSIP